MIGVGGRVLPVVGHAGAPTSADGSRWHFSEPGATGRVCKLPALHTHGEIIIGHCPCIRCRYQLSGTPQAGVCPECGLAKNRSLRSLYRSSPPYLEQLSRGLLMMALAPPVGILVPLASALLLAAVGKIIHSTTTNKRLDIPDWLAFLCVAATALVGPAMALWGLCRIMRPEPAVDGRLNRMLRSTTAKWMCAGHMASVGVFGLVMAVVVSHDYQFGLACAGSASAILIPLIWTARNAALARVVNVLSKRLAMRQRGMTSVILMVIGFVLGILAAISLGTFAGAMLLLATAIVAVGSVAIHVSVIDRLRKQVRRARVTAVHRLQAEAAASASVRSPG